jgi:hypothetical protein
MKLQRTLLAIGLSIAPAILISGPVSAASVPANIGNDISYPQCGKTLPAKQAFGIVGVNGGLANTTNSCLAAQLAWAAQSAGTTVQPKTQLYVNTANPGGLGTASWPANNTDPSGNTSPNTYGTCDGTDSLACAWQYGWNRAAEDAVQRLAPAAQTAGASAATSAYTWWLDIETANTWKAGNAAALQSNRADLEGMTAYFKAAGAAVGLYSTTAQWGAIAGTPATGSTLLGLPNWRPGARNLSQAKSNCSLPPLTTGGRVVLTQYVASNLDYDNSCI